jgi:hypothetical protein
MNISLKTRFINVGLVDVVDFKNGVLTLQQCLEKIGTFKKSNGDSVEVTKKVLKKYKLIGASSDKVDSISDGELLTNFETDVTSDGYLVIETI